MTPTTKRRRFASVIVRKRIAGTVGGQADLTSERFGKLVAIRPTDQRRHGTVVWECLCDCGKTCEVPLGTLTNGHRKSCGCNGAKIGPVEVKPLHPESWDRDVFDPLERLMAMGYGDTPRGRIPAEVLAKAGVRLGAK